MLTEAMKMASRCYVILREKGVIQASASPEEYSAYHTDPDVRDLLDQMEESEPNFCRVLDVSQSNAIYLVPTAQSPSILNKGSFKDKFLSATDTYMDVYTDLVIILFILHAFYGGKNAVIKQRQFLTYDDIVQLTDERCHAVLSSMRNRDAADMSGINMLDVARTWKDTPLGDDPLNKRGAPKKTTRRGRVMHVIQILTQEKMFIYIQASGQIRPTQRLDDIMTGYYLNHERVQEINECLDMIISEGDAVSA